MSLPVNVGMLPLLSVMQPVVYLSKKQQNRKWCSPHVAPQFVCLGRGSHMAEDEGGRRTGSHWLARSAENDEEEEGIRF